MPVGEKQRSVAVIGAGLSGLTAAYRLQSCGWNVSVMEATARVGGRVDTVDRQGFKIDTGASVLTDSYTAYLALVEDLGIKEAIVPAKPSVGIVRDGKVHLMDLRRLAKTGLLTPLLSMRSKVAMLRLAKDVAHAARRGELDYSDMRRAAPIDTETAQRYLLRELNSEIDAYIGDPVVRTMQLTNTDKVSKVELFSGLANIFTRRVFGLSGGQGRLPRMLAAKVNPRLECRVTRVEQIGDAIEVASNSGGETRTERFDFCVVACPLDAAMEICVGHQDLLRPLSKALSYGSAITVAVATRRRPACPAFLIQLPACEDKNIALMFLDHNKCDDRAPEGKGLIVVHWEAQASAIALSESDDEISARTLRSLFAVFPELKEVVEFVHVTRWPTALPVARVGVFQEIGAFNAALDRRSKVQFAADFMSAAGQNTAVEFGERAAKNLMAASSTPSKSLVPA